MLQLSLNTIPRDLFPMPIVKCHYQLQHLQELKNEQENQILQDHSRLLKERTPNRREFLFLKNKRQSTVDMKTSLRKVSEYHHTSQQIAIDHSIDLKHLNKSIVSEQQFQIKQNQIQQMIREKLYLSYTNSLKKKSKLAKILQTKINQLAPYIISKEKKSLHLRSQSIPINYDSVYNSIQRVQSMPRKQQKRKMPTEALFQNKDADRIVRKLNQKTKKLLSGSYPEIDPTPVVDYQRQILSKIELRNSTKKKLVESFQDIIAQY